MELARHGDSGKLVQLPGGVDVRRERRVGFLHKFIAIRAPEREKTRAGSLGATEKSHEKITSTKSILETAK
jgi:hypothetical protein